MSRSPRERLAVAARACLALARPSHLLLVLVVYGAGVAMGVAAFGAATPTGVAARPATATRAAVGALPLLAVAASVHYANEYADRETDALTVRTPFSGGSGTLQRYDLPPRFALGHGLASLALGAIAAPVALSGIAPAALLAVIAAAGWQYSVRPLALAWRGLGEVTNAALGGLVLPAYGVAVAAGTVPPRAWLYALPFAAVVYLNLLETQWPDRRADAAVGKRTLATRWSRRGLRRAYDAGLAVTAAALPAALATGLPPLVAVLHLLVAPLLWWGRRRYTRRWFPFPTVVAMVLLAGLSLVGWTVVAIR